MSYLIPSVRSQFEAQTYSNNVKFVLGIKGPLREEHTPHTLTGNLGVYALDTKGHLTCLD